MTNKRNYQPLIAGRVPGKSPSVVVGREQELERHFDKIEIEFAGKPKLCFHLAKVIVLIRREVDLEKNVDEFFTILYQHVGLLCQYMSTRWLIAICDTVADHGSPVQKASALNIVVMVNTIKLAESERLSESKSRSSKPDSESYFSNWPCELWDGVTSYHLETGDMPRNMIARILVSMQSTPALKLIFETVLDRLKRSDNLFSRLASLNQSGFWEKEV